MGCPAAAASYAPRQSHACDAARVVREHLSRFSARLEAELPAFVTDELRAFGTCGDFEQGFLLAACNRCGEQLRVPFACRGRGVCPSCMGRRMSETAALLVDHRLPKVPYRQWVLSFPGPVATRLGYDQELLGLVCSKFAQRVMQALRRRVKKAHDRKTVRDLTQGLFAKLVESNSLERLDRDASRFRAYLRKAADHYAKDERIRREAQKRGYGQAPLPFDTTEAEQRYGLEGDHSLSPEAAFDRRWALTVLERAEARIHEGLEKKNQGDRWQWLAPLLRDEGDKATYEAIAERTGKRPDAVKMWVSRMRKRHRQFVEEEVRDTVGSERERGEELVELELG